MFCVFGEWERAVTQLDAAAQLDPIALPMAQAYRAAIRCEMLRARVFAGARTPTIFARPGTVDVAAGRGEPRAWPPAGQPRRQSCATTRSSRRRRPAARSAAKGSMGRRSTGSPMPIRGWDRCWKPSSTANTTGCRSIACARSTSSRRRTCETRSGCRRTSSGPTAGKWSGFVPTRYPGSETADDPTLALATPHRMAGKRHLVPRPRPAHADHRRRGVRPDGHQTDRVPPV